MGVQEQTNKQTYDDLYLHLVCASAACLRTAEDAARIQTSLAVARYPRSRDIEKWIGRAVIYRLVRSRCANCRCRRCCQRGRRAGRCRSWNGNGGTGSGPWPYRLLRKRMRMGVWRRGQRGHAMRQPVASTIVHPMTSTLRRIDSDSLTRLTTAPPFFVGKLTSLDPFTCFPHFPLSPLQADLLRSQTSRTYPLHRFTQEHHSIRTGHRREPAGTAKGAFDVRSWRRVGWTGYGWIRRGSR
jgi:hypothetical protein